MDYDADGEYRVQEGGEALSQSSERFRLIHNRDTEISCARNGRPFVLTLVRNFADSDRITRIRKLCCFQSKLIRP
jgi:hypothetical protein